MEFLLQPLTHLTFFPLVGVLVILFLKSEQKNTISWTALVTTLLTFGISLWVLTQFKAANPDLQLEAKYSWIQVAGWDIQYYLAVDGLSILLVLLTGLLTPISILSTWTAVEDRVKDFMIFFLLLEVGMMGVFLVQDLFLFYIFWEFGGMPVRGREVTMKLRQDHYVSAGDLFLFGSVLDCFLGVYASINSFTNLIIHEVMRGDTYRWPARLGNHPLI